jgi:hypothetical protein
MDRPSEAAAAGLSRSGSLSIEINALALSQGFFSVGGVGEPRGPRRPRVPPAAPLADLNSVRVCLLTSVRRSVSQSACLSCPPTPSPSLSLRLSLTRGAFASAGSPAQSDWGQLCLSASVCLSLQLEHLWPVWPSLVLKCAGPPAPARVHAPGV